MAVKLVLQLVRPLRRGRRHPPYALCVVDAAQGRGRLRRAGQAGHSRRARHGAVSVAERASLNGDSFRVDAGGAGRRGELVSPRPTCNTTRALHLLVYLDVASARHASRARLLPETSNRRTARVLCTSSRRVTNCPTLVAPSYTRRLGGVPTRLVSSSLRSSSPSSPLALRCSPLSPTYLLFPAPPLASSFPAASTTSSPRRRRRRRFLRVRPRATASSMTTTTTTSSRSGTS